MVNSFISWKPARPSARLWEGLWGGVFTQAMALEQALTAQ